MNTPQPSADALRLAVKLSGHDGTQCKYGARICEGCVADARIIDETLQLPARNAALLVVQTLVDAWTKDGSVIARTAGGAELMVELREALARIKTP